MADATLMKVPASLDPLSAMLMGDVFSTGFFCADMAGAAPGKVVAVIGCGPVGLMAVIGAVERGASRVFAIDAVPERLNKAASYGAEPINFRETDVEQTILAATHGLGVDAVLEAVGNPSSAKTAFALVRPGGTIAVAGVHNEAQFAFSPANAYDKNLTYRVGRCPARQYMNELLPLAQSGKYDIQSIFSHRFSLEQGKEGYRIFAEKKERCTKVVLIP